MFLVQSCINLKLFSSFLLFKRLNISMTMKGKVFLVIVRDSGGQKTKTAIFRNRKEYADFFISSILSVMKKNATCSVETCFCSVNSESKNVYRNRVNSLADTSRRRMMWRHFRKFLKFYVEF